VRAICGSSHGAVLVPGGFKTERSNMNATIHNPFLTLDVNTACSEARVLYLDTLARMQQNGGQPVDWLERLQQQSQRNLDNYWDAALIPSCVLRSHSEMGKIRHRMKKLLVIFKLQQLVTKSITNGLKRGKSTVIESFFPYFLPDMFNRI